MLVILIEHSYIDQETINHLSNSFYLKYRLNYLNDPTNKLGGNVRFLVGNKQANQFKSEIRSILKELDSYTPFLQLLAVYYNQFWFSRSQLDQILELVGRPHSQYQLTQFHFSQFSLFHSILKFNLHQLINFLVELNKKQVNGR
jgi:hypothetical protein